MELRKINIRHVTAYARTALLLSVYTLTIQPDLPSVKVRNAAQAVETALSHLRKKRTAKVPDSKNKWKEKTIYTTGPQDLAVTGKLFTSDDWLIEVSQGVAPLSSTIYRITVFSTEQKYYWKGSVRADGGVTEVSAFRALSEEESQKLAEEFVKRSQVPPPRSGGYGH